MTDLDATLRAELDRLIPMPSRATASWDDALDRAAGRPAQPLGGARVSRRVAVALAVAALAAAVVAATPLGAAIGRSVEDFSAWLTGEPGEPASPAEQRAFEEGEQRSWGILADSPRLRRLVRVERGAARFTLYGFRTETALCVRLVTEGVGEPPATWCAPLDALREEGRPALVAVADYPVGRRDLAPTEVGYLAPRFATTVGIVADGVAAVEAVSDRVPNAVSVAGNAFLAVAASPPLGARTRRLVVRQASGDTAEVPIGQSPFDAVGLSGPGAVAPGPRVVERRLSGGSVAWFAPDERRFVRPDPTLPYLLSVLPGPDDVCMELIGGQAGSMGCAPLDGVFARGPFSVAMSAAGGHNPYVVVHGLASDDVARLELFLATAERRVVPLRDNAYVVAVPRARYPARLVAYDDEDRVIGIEHFDREPFAGLSGPIEGAQRVVHAVRTEGGVRVTLQAGPSSDGGRCFRVEAGDVPKVVMCTDPSYAGLGLIVVRAAADSFVMGPVGSAVERLKIRYRGGATDAVTPVEGFVIAPVRSRLGDLDAAVALDHVGRELDRQELR